MNQSKIAITIGIIILIGIVAYASTREPVEQPRQENILVLNYSGTTTTPQNIQIKEGEDITIKVTSPVADEVHIHGYDKTIELVPDIESSLTFNANLTGKYEIELHEAHVLLGTIEVYPQ